MDNTVEYRDFAKEFKMNLHIGNGVKVKKLKEKISRIHVQGNFLEKSNFSIHSGVLIFHFSLMKKLLLSSVLVTILVVATLGTSSAMQ